MTDGSAIEGGPDERGPDERDPDERGSAAAAAAALARVERDLERRQPHRMIPDLGRISALVDLLGQPQRSFPSIHITGTNGKTSTARMIDALLRAFGLRTGRYTSPHLESVRERICVDGLPLSAQQFARTYDEVLPYVEIVDARSPEPVTYFELLTVMGFAAFADAPVEVGVVEVGLGGSWDATNVLDARVAVVTPIAYDHTELLGTSLEDIATEKAGVIAPGATVVLAQQDLTAAQALLHRAVEVDAQVAREGIEFGVLRREVAVGGQTLSLQGLAASYVDVLLPLHGEHMAHNAACALAAVEAFLGTQRGPLDDALVREGFAHADSPGRLEVVRRSPTILVDAAHNPAGAQALAAGIEEAFAFSSLIAVVGVLADKDAEGLLAALEPVVTTFVATQNSSPRCLPARELAETAAAVAGQDRVLVRPRLADALDTAAGLADEFGPGAGVLVTGSIVTVGQARRMLRAGGPDPSSATV
ncbi:MAG: bifunctional folylpolyglutamate synthase/dihydrofolate synthase [Frankiaceae bacterium]